MSDDPKYHLRVARSAARTADNVLWFDWCGYVYAEPYGTYDLSIFLRNVAVAGALCAAFDQGVLACPCSWQATTWFPGWALVRP